MFFAAIYGILPMFSLNIAILRFFVYFLLYRLRIVYLSILTDTVLHMRYLKREELSATILRALALSIAKYADVQSFG